MIIVECALKELETLSQTCGHEMTKCLKEVEEKDASRPSSLIKKDDASLPPEKNGLDDKSFLSTYSSLSPDPFY